MRQRLVLMDGRLEGAAMELEILLCVYNYNISCSPAQATISCTAHYEILSAATTSKSKHTNANLSCLVTEENPSQWKPEILCPVTREFVLNCNPIILTSDWLRAISGQCGNFWFFRFQSSLISYRFMVSWWKLMGRIDKILLLNWMARW